jgi:hypothetical protein
MRLRALKLPGYELGKDARTGWVKRNARGLLQFAI